MRSRRPWSLTLLVVGALVLAGCSSATEPAAQPAVPGEQPSSAGGPGEVTATSTPTSTPSDDPSGVAVALPGVLPRGERPRFPYVSGRDLLHPDGSRLRLGLDMRGPWGVTSIVTVPDGYLVTDDRAFEGTIGMHLLDPEGQAQEAWASTGPARLGPSGQVAWLRVPVPEANQTWPAEIHVDDRTQELPGHLGPRILQFDGALVVYSALVLRAGRARPRTFETAVPGRPRRVASPVERVVSPRLRHWWGWTRSGLELGRGDAVLVSVEDRAVRRAMAEPVWEDERHLLVTVVRGGRQALVRLGVDGEVERATPWTRATPAGHAVLRTPPSRR